MADKDLQYKISTTADTKGADAATAAIKKADQAAKETTKTADQGNTALKQQAEITGNLSAGANVLGEVMRGNLRALGQFPAVLRAIAVAAAANPLFALGAVASAVIVPALTKITDGWKKQAEAAEEAAEKSAEAGRTARTAMTETSTNNVEKQFNDISAAADKARASIDAALAAQIEFNNAEEAVALARLDAQPGLSPLQRQLRRGAIREEFRGRNQRLELERIDAVPAEAEREVERLRAALPSASAQVAAAQRRLDIVSARPPEQIEAELEANQFRRLQLLNARTPEDFAEAEELRLAASALAAELKVAKERFAKDVESASADLAKAQAEEAERLEQVGKAARRAQDAEDKAQNDRARVFTTAARDREVDAVSTRASLAEAGITRADVPVSFRQPGVRAAEDEAIAAKTSEAASKVEKAQERASGGVIEFAGATYKSLSGVLTRLDQQAETIRAHTRQMERLGARLDNLNSSQQ